MLFIARWAGVAKAVAEMQEAGFTNVSNLAGGILAWIDKIDASLDRY